MNQVMRVGWFTLVVALVLVMAVTESKADTPATTVATETQIQPSASQPTTLPATSQPATSQPTAVLPSAELLQHQAIELALAGNFEAAAETMRQAVHLSPEYKPSLREYNWLQEYLTYLAANNVAKQNEYELAVDMAKQLLEIAQTTAAVDEQVNEQLDKLRQEVKDVIKAVADLLAAPLSQENYDGPQWFPERLSKDAAKIGQGLDAVSVALAETPKTYADHVRDVIERVRLSLRDFEAAAGRQKWDCIENGRNSLDDIEDQIDALSDTLDGLNAMTSDTPWRAALDQLRLAKRILNGVTGFMDEPWACDIVAGAEKRIEALRQDRQWYKALGIYNALAELYEGRDDQRYQDDIRRISRQARVISMYGPAVKGVAETAQTQPAKPEKRKQPHWKDYIIGVDTFAVRRAISQIHRRYVENVDYRKVLL
ncbi:MAG: hypothetical protein HQ546_09500, partial [Planctomycetes bacterium]|nr:hypothetical protein [Planctomycetota bacterium]